MDIKKSTIYSLLKKKEVVFVIPEYQRPYSWDKKNTKDFWQDISSSINDKEKHYFGNIVLHVHRKRGWSNKRHRDKPSEYHIVDGQQRIATAMLMIAAIYHLKKLREDDERSSGKTSEAILDKLLFNNKSAKLKLKTVTTDQKHFTEILNIKGARNIDYSAKQSYLHDAYNSFKSKLKKETDLDQYIDGLKNLEVAYIQVDDEDNPQKIFERINTTGKSLTEGDKIRNFILMLKNKGDYNYVYQEYWQKLEKNLTNGKDVDIQSFFHDYLVSVLDKPVVVNSEYEEFKKYFRLEVPDIGGAERYRKRLDNFYSDMQKWLDRYMFLRYGHKRQLFIKYKMFSQEVFRINYLKINALRPFFMSVLRDFDEEKISKERVYEVFFITENYLIRRIIGEGNIMKAGDFFSTVNKKINRDLNNSTKKDYLATYRYWLDNDYPAPVLEKIKAGIKYNDMGGNKANLEFILTSVEQRKATEASLLQNFTKNSPYTIEHVMPKKLNEGWRQELGENHQDIHRSWVNTLPNLTLTNAAKNKQISNSEFAKKKESLEADSFEKLNERILDKTNWDVESLEDRKDWWFEMVEELWPISG